MGIDWWLSLLCVVAGIALLSLYWLRLRRFRLLAKHAAWQLEAQAVEKATHEALIEGLSDEEKVLTIVVPVVNERDPLEPLLRNLIGQKYKREYEILVADENHTAEIEALCERIQRNDFSRLRYTFVPDSSRYIERRKLAITLGMRAARGEWVMVLSPDTLPVDDQWLYHISQSLIEGNDMVMAYYNYDDDGSLVARRAIFDRVCDLATRMEAWDDGLVMGCLPSAWAVRKSWFLSENGFADSVNLAFGEEAVFACLHADTERTALLCSPSTRLVEALPSADVLQTRRMRACEVMHFLAHPLRRYRQQDMWASIATYAFVSCQLAYLIGRLVMDIHNGIYTLALLPTDIISVVLWGVGLTLSVVMVRLGLRTLDERKYGAYIYLYELLRPLHAIATELERSTHQHDFERKFI